MNILKISLLGFVMVAILTTITYSKKAKVPTPILVQEEPQVILTPIEMVDKYAIQYGVNQTIFKKVMYCESGGKPAPKGHNDGGRAYGIMQFHRPTFDSYSKKLGEKLDYKSYNDQIKLAAYMFSIGEANHWTAYRALMNGGVYIFTDRSGKTHTVRCK